MEQKEITLADLSKLTGVSTNKLIYRIKQNQIMARKVGWFYLIPETEVEKVKRLYGQ